MESSVSSSRPFECYRFNIEGVDGELRYTSDEMAVTAEGILFQPLKGLKRGGVGVRVIGETSETVITCPADSELVSKCGIFGTPRVIAVDVRRYQRADPNTFVMRITGKALGVSLENELGTIKLADRFAAGLATMVPKDKTQAPCNYMLGDDDCRKDLTGMGVTVTSIVQNAVWSQLQDGDYTVMATFDADPYAPELWQGGVISMTVGSFTETRTIWESIPLVSSSDLPRVRLKLGKSFTLPFGAHTIRIMPGCDNSLLRCQAFNNVENFGGYPDMPTERQNPFRLPLAKGRKA